MSTQSERANVVDLVDANVPADQGLSSLALLMQLAGNLFAAGAALFAFVVLFAQRGAQVETLWIFVVLGLAIARSMLHRAAGAHLLYGDGNTSRLAGIRRYIGFSLIQTSVTFALLVGKWHAPTKSAVGISAALLVWPVALAILLALPRFQRFRADLPITEDKGFEGASILMLVLGLCGLAFGSAILFALLDLPGRALQQGMGVLVVLATGMLVVRSALHVQAGFSGLRETSVDRSVELANRYANFGVISAFCVAGAMLLFVMQMSVDLAGLALISGLCWMLISWPLVVRRFFSDRQFAELLAGERAPVHHRAPDAGLTGLGWLLLAHGLFVATVLILEWSSSGTFGSRQLRSLDVPSDRSLWWSVGVVVLQCWAGFELVRMSPQSRIIATIFGVVATAVTVYVSWPLLLTLKHGGLLRGPQLSMMVGMVALRMIVPVATVLLVNRKISPSARARYRARAEAPAPAPAPIPSAHARYQARADAPAPAPISPTEPPKE